MNDANLELERYELREPQRYEFATDRRVFNATLGAGLMLLLARDNSHAQPGRRQPRRGEPLGDRLHVAEDGIVTVLTSKVEVGQGSRTQITQAAAEELRLPIEKIQLVMADTEQCPDDGGTAGSRTTPSTVPRVRSACAAARERLVELAAATLEVEPGEVQYDRGTFTTAGRTMSLADLVREAEVAESLQAPPNGEAQVRRVSEWQVLGVPTNKVGAEAIVTGQHRYPSDYQLPGMEYGKVLRPPSYGAKLTSIDLEAGQKLEGVTVVRDGDFVGCTAPSSWQAGKAIEALVATAEWETVDHPSSENLFTHLKETAREGGGRRGRRGGGAAGDVDAALESANQSIDSSFEIAYIQHAPMEPRAAVAEWSDGKLTVWTGSQQPSRVEGELRGAFGLRGDGVRVIVPDTGGGFGGKHTGEAAVEAARLAKAAGKPVSLRWTREEEFTWAYFRPAGLIEVKAALDDQGRIVAWDFANYNSGGSALDTPYRVPNKRERVLECDSPLRQGSYRALASTANTFAREVAMDELAELAGVDPLDFRLAHLEEGRLRNVLVAATEKFGWRKRRAEGRNIGLACGTEKGSYVAACVEADVVDGEVQNLLVCQAYECGAIHNPTNLRSQVEGAIVMGLGAALREAMEFSDGQIQNASFYSYEVPRMRDLPEMELVLVNRPDLPSVGAGETPIIAIAPALAGAVYAATGGRSRSMPLKLG
ncbi:molybdopterin-dependent oxidoreductase [Aeoliella sp. ICT_H6.2]|uniref:Molybdopterin-dependent oxidoreductase n=1 Tax=Aeoliella straminimaris TaxID=2954799 RepID=A0A9X2F9K2_9BACT|nr:molybdopterin cofactor-binding domain-containing protein [Aeoliella straminimaris]MCO6044148.1 molybdopterin-dependent oxidoreductase [Aeoliella straminimaris]